MYFFISVFIPSKCWLYKQRLDNNVWFIISAISVQEFAATPKSLPLQRDNILSLWFVPKNNPLVTVVDLVMLHVSRHASVARTLLAVLL